MAASAGAKVGGGVGTGVIALVVALFVGNSHPPQDDNAARGPLVTPDAAEMRLADRVHDLVDGDQPPDIILAACDAYLERPTHRAYREEISRIAERQRLLLPREVELKRVIIRLDDAADEIREWMTGSRRTFSLRVELGDEVLLLTPFSRADLMLSGHTATLGWPTATLILPPDAALRGELRVSLRSIDGARPGTTDVQSWTRLVQSGPLPPAVQFTGGLTLELDEVPPP